MKIENGKLTSAQATEASRTQDAAFATKARGNPWTSAPPEDSVGVSDIASRIGKIAAVHETRMSERVSQLAAQYARGEYNVDAATLSHTIVSDALKGGIGE